MADSDTVITSGLLSAVADGLLEYDERIERTIAQGLLRELDNAISRERSASALSCRSFRIEELRFQKKLVQFALRKRVSLRRDDWKQRVLEIAAHEHPDLNPNAKPVGRPKKLVSGGLLSLLSESPTRHWDMVSKMQQYLQKGGGKHVTIKMACEETLAYLEENKGRKVDRTSEQFRSNVRTLQTRVSEQRKKITKK